MSDVRFYYNDYRNLTQVEFMGIIGYFGKTLDTRFINYLLQSDTIPTKDMRRFIADVVTGRVKPKNKGRPFAIDLNYEIYERVTFLLSLKHWNLTPNGNKDGVINIVAEGLAESGLNMSEDAVLKQYQRAKKHMNEINGGDYKSVEDFIKNWKIENVRTGVEDTV